MDRAAVFAKVVVLSYRHLQEGVKPYCEKPLKPTHGEHWLVSRLL